jgi:hypothetical protein
MKESWILIIDQWNILSVVLTDRWNILNAKNSTICDFMLNNVGIDILMHLYH